MLIAGLILLQNITKLTQTVDELSARDCGGYFLLARPIDWYGKTFSRVRWNGVFSRLDSIRSGISQVGILSPFLVNIYVDSLISVLRSSDSDLGCHIGSTYIGCLAYADDFILLSGSVAQLQDMLKFSFAHAENLHIKFNATKSCLLKICNNLQKIFRV